MKKIVTKFLMLLPLCLTSCTETKAWGATYGIKIFNKDSGYVKINAYQLELYYKASLSFSFFLYSDTCGICDTAKTVINNNIKNTGLLFFAVEVDNTSAKYLYENMGSVLGQIQTPSAYTNSHKGMTYKYDTDAVTRQRNFDSAVKRWTIDSNCYFATSREDALEIFNACDDALIFTYSSKYAPCADFFTTYAALINQKTTYKSIIVDDMFNGIAIPEDTTDYSKNYFISRKKAGQETTTAYYLDPNQTQSAADLI